MCGRFTRKLFFFQLIPTSSLGEQPWTLINKRALSGRKSMKQKTGNSHMSSASPTQIPLYPLHTVKKAIANRMTSKAVKLDPTLLMSCCAVSEAVGVGLVSDCCPQDASLPWCLSRGRDVWVSRRFQVFLFCFFVYSLQPVQVLLRNPIFNSESLWCAHIEESTVRRRLRNCLPRRLNLLETSEMCLHLCGYLTHFQLHLYGALLRVYHASRHKLSLYTLYI